MTDKIPIDTALIAAMFEGVLTGHPNEANLRALLEENYIMALSENPDDPDEFLVFMLSPDRTDALPIGAFPVADVMPSQN